MTEGHKGGSPAPAVLLGFVACGLIFKGSRIPGVERSSNSLLIADCRHSNPGPLSDVTNIFTFEKRYLLDKDIVDLLCEILTGNRRIYGDIRSEKEQS